MSRTPQISITLEEDVWREIALTLEEQTPDNAGRYTSLKEANAFIARHVAIRTIREVVPKRRKRTTDEEQD